LRKNEWERDREREREREIGERERERERERNLRVSNLENSPDWKPSPTKCFAWKILIN
jgi:hypothetical protein